MDYIIGPLCKISISSSSPSPSPSPSVLRPESDGSKSPRSPSRGSNSKASGFRVRDSSGSVQDSPTTTVITFFCEQQQNENQALF